MQVTLAQIARLAPNARSGYRQAFATGQAVLDRHQISATRLRLAHFMAQVLHESGGFAILYESLNYSAQRLPKVWPTRFKPTGPQDPAPFAHNPEKLGNEVYGGRMGNDQPGDGYTYRGRGLLQLTGKASYAEAAATLRLSDAQAPDFVAQPDAVLDARWCLQVAAAEWSAKGCNEAADLDQINTVTRRINGGLTGLADRVEWLKRTKVVWA